MKLAMPAALTDTSEDQTAEALWQGGVFMAVTLIAMTAGLWGRTDYTSAPEPGLLIVAAASYLPLFFRKRWPIPVLGVVVALEILHLILLPLLTDSVQATDSVTAFQPVPIATMAAMYTVAIRKDPATAWAAGLAAGAVLFGVASILYPANLLTTTLVMGNLVIIATAIGTTVRHRRTSRSAREQAHQQHVRREVLAERMRIARELHDVLAHNLTLVNAQAGVAKYLLQSDPSAAEAALGNITIHTRKAIDDLRSTVGLLREDNSSTSHPLEGGRQRARTRERAPESMPVAGDSSVSLQPADLAPTHTLEHLPEMLDMFRSAGNSVTISEDGKPADLPPLKDLSAYRIIQESLTNAAKHAPGARISVALRWQDSAVDITVTNDPPPPARRDHHRAHRPAGTGHGLIGMRERAVTAGGTFTAGPLPDGSYMVHACIPTRQHKPERTS